MNKGTVKWFNNQKGYGFITDAETGKGNVLFNSDYYINYASVPDIANGNVICTYLIYNPDTSYEDDIIARFDYIIDTKTE